MKKKSTLVNFLVFGGLAITFGYSNTAIAQASLELSCRVKAKELAAETYKGCMTEGRQSQIEQIRNDYKEKLSELKNHYDKELKKLGSNQENTSSENGSLKSKYEAKKADLKKSKQRLSGARMPQKKSTTQVIDFNTQTTESSMGVASDDNLDAKAQIDTQATGNDEIEVVELPAQK